MWQLSHCIQHNKLLSNYSNDDCLTTNLNFSAISVFQVFLQYRLHSSIKLILCQVRLHCNQSVFILHTMTSVTFTNAEYFSYSTSGECDLANKLSVNCVIKLIWFKIWLKKIASQPSPTFNFTNDDRQITTGRLCTNMGIITYHTKVWR